jgi:hypothetical protein
MPSFYNKKCIIILPRQARDKHTVGEAALRIEMMMRFLIDCTSEPTGRCAAKNKNDALFSLFFSFLSFSFLFCEMPFSFCASELTPVLN